MTVLTGDWHLHFFSMVTLLPLLCAAGAELDGLTTNLLLDDHRQLPGWGHIPLGGIGARPSLGGMGGMTTHTGRGSVGSNMLTMHTVSSSALVGAGCDALGDFCTFSVKYDRQHAHQQQTVEQHVLAWQ